MGKCTNTLLARLVCIKGNVSLPSWSTMGWQVYVKGKCINTPLEHNGLVGMYEGKLYQYPLGTIGKCTNTLLQHNGLVGIYKGEMYQYPLGAQWVRRYV